MLRTDLWATAFIRRHNSLGHICVLSRKGDPIAGQIFVEIDHLDGTVSLFMPAPQLSRSDDGEDRVFQCRLARVKPAQSKDRIAREAQVDPDLWVVNLEMRDGDSGLATVVP